MRKIIRVIYYTHRAASIDHRSMTVGTETVAMIVTSHTRTRTCVCIYGEIRILRWKIYLRENVHLIKAQQHVYG